MEYVSTRFRRTEPLTGPLSRRPRRVGLRAISHMSSGRGSVGVGALRVPQGRLRAQAIPTPGSVRMCAGGRHSVDLLRSWCTKTPDSGSRGEIGPHTSLSNWRCVRTFRMLHHDASRRNSMGEPHLHAFTKTRRPTRFTFRSPTRRILRPSIRLERRREARCAP